MAATGVVAVGTVGGFLISGAVASSSPSYVTAVATTAGVSQTLPLTGVVVPVRKVDASFQVAGTVSSVDVSMGQQVSAGQTLASIESSSLQQNVNNDEAILTAAESKLAADEANQSPSASSGNSNASTTSAVEGRDTGIVLTAVTIPSHKGSGAGGSIAADQQAVVAGQRALDADLQASAAAFRQAQMTCGTGSGKPPTPTSTSAATTTSTAATSTTTSTTVPGGGTSNSACVAALGQAEQAALKVNNDEQMLAGAESNLAQALSKEASAAKSSGGGSSAGRSPSGGTSTSSGVGSHGATVNTDTPQQLASDQATIDSDEANLVVAQQNLSDAVLVAPISGMVVGVGLAADQLVSAGSTSATVTITSVGAYEADATLTTAQVSQLVAGDRAQVSVNGVAGTFDGTVTRIGPVQVSNSTYTYPLVIALDTRGTQFPAGADALLTVYLHSVGSAVVVPTSAVHTNGATSYVLVPRGSSDQQVRVTVGAVGAVYTQITSGLSRGTVVVLADRSTKVPSSNTQNNNTGAFNGNGTTRVFTGGGFGGFTPRGGGAGG